MCFISLVIRVLTVRNTTKRSDWRKDKIEQADHWRNDEPEHADHCEKKRDMQ